MLVVGGIVCWIVYLSIFLLFDDNAALLAGLLVSLFSRVVVVDAKIVVVVGC